MSVGVVLVTHNARHLLPQSLPPFLNSEKVSEILVLNSSSADGTVEYAEKMGCKTLVVPRDSFNHGTSRELARTYLNHEIAIMATPDAILQSPNMIDELLRPLNEKSCAVSYARQVSHRPESFFETFPRDFNYPGESQQRTFENKERWGSYAMFCSNSLAAWKNKALDRIGGFKPVLTGEDTLACAELLQAGFSVNYCSECIAGHSHTYSLSQEFKRSFDTGYARAMNKKVFSSFDSDSSRGVAYAKAMLQTLVKRAPQKIPYALCNLSMRYLGYLLGKSKPPKNVCRHFSGQDFYWV